MATDGTRSPRRLMNTGTSVSSFAGPRPWEEPGRVTTVVGDLEAVEILTPDVPLATPNPSADTGIIQVVPEGGPTSQATEDLVHAVLLAPGGQLAAACRYFPSGTIFLAVAMTSAVYLVTDLVFHAPFTLTLTGLTAAAFAWFWYGLPLSRKARD
jgi:hypothetical protein